MNIFRKTVSLAALAPFGLCAPASAHFKMLKPTSWLKEDDVGGPQKGSPCGPGGMGLLGDDVNPVSGRPVLRMEWKP